MEVERPLVVVEPLNDDVVGVSVGLGFLVADVAEVNAAASGTTEKVFVSGQGIT